MLNLSLTEVDRVVENYKSFLSQVSNVGDDRKVFDASVGKGRPTNEKGL